MNTIKDNGARSINRLQEVVDLHKMEFRTVEITVDGISPLIVHNWSEKAVRMMLDKQMGKASKGREKKDPLKDFKGSLYKIDSKSFGIAAPAFKACCVTASNSVELKMTQMRQAFHVKSYTVPILAPPLPDKYWTEWDHEYEKDLKNEHAAGLSMRMDMVRLESGVADIRFRGSWPVWSAALEVEYNTAMISLEQLLMLFEAGGRGCGVGEWRPSAPVCRSGEYGRFTVRRK